MKTIDNSFYYFGRDLDDAKEFASMVESGDIPLDAAVMVSMHEFGVLHTRSVNRHISPDGDTIIIIYTGSPSEDAVLPPEYYGLTLQDIIREIKNTTKPNMVCIWCTSIILGYGSITKFDIMPVTGILYDTVDKVIRLRFKSTVWSVGADWAENDPNGYLFGLNAFDINMHSVPSPNIMKVANGEYIIADAK